jgi:hypothetical protein
MNDNEPQFEPFEKMARLSRGCVITEKLDGTNAQVFISEDLSIVRAGSRNRWITPEDDNYGFAGWVERNREELLLLGPGRHFGEWWGAGIQRRYGRSGQDGKTFSLFNTGRWLTNPDRPSCCDVVPLLYAGVFNDTAVEETLEKLRVGGSVAAPGFMDPEGIVVFHTASRTLFKKTLKNDEVPKGMVAT